MAAFSHFLSPHSDLAIIHTHTHSAKDTDTQPKIHTYRHSHTYMHTHTLSLSFSLTQTFLTKMQEFSNQIQKVDKRRGEGLRCHAKSISLGKSVFDPLSPHVTLCSSFGSTPFPHVTNQKVTNFDGEKNGVPLHLGLERCEGAKKCQHINIVDHVFA